MGAYCPFQVSLLLRKPLCLCRNMTQLSFVLLLLLLSVVSLADQKRTVMTVVRYPHASPFVDSCVPNRRRRRILLRSWTCLAAQISQVQLTSNFRPYKMSYAADVHIDRLLVQLGHKQVQIRRISELRCLFP